MTNTLLFFLSCPCQTETRVLRKQSATAFLATSETSRRRCAFPGTKARGSLGQNPLLSCTTLQETLKKPGNHCQKQKTEGSVLSLHEYFCCEYSSEVAHPLAYPYRHLYPHLLPCSIYGSVSEFFGEAFCVLLFAGVHDSRLPPMSVESPHLRPLISSKGIDQMRLDGSRTHMGSSHTRMHAKFDERLVCIAASSLCSSELNLQLSSIPHTQKFLDDPQCASKTVRCASS
ncbi:hypothetical protein R3P38DRAFT_194244 [Favolaschia claudopus]|uniref:Uncharacterized protein n=1 Tax=Favolaschia claudopus TaxID=2862362 RepID=A0AAV9ZU24_9AGAR